MHKYDINLTILSLHSPPSTPLQYSSFSSLPLGPIPPYAFIFISFSLFLSRFCVHRLVWLRQRRKARPRGNNLSVCTAAWTPGSMRSLPPVPSPWAPQSSKLPILCVHLVLHTHFLSTLSTWSPHGDFPHCYIVLYGHIFLSSPWFCCPYVYIRLSHQLLFYSLFLPSSIISAFNHAHYSVPASVVLVSVVTK